MVVDATGASEEVVAASEEVVVSSEEVVAASEEVVVAASPVVRVARATKTSLFQTLAESSVWLRVAETVLPVPRSVSVMVAFRVARVLV